MATGRVSRTVHRLDATGAVGTLAALGDFSGSEADWAAVEAIDKSAGRKSSHSKSNGEDPRVGPESPADEARSRPQPRAWTDFLLSIHWRPWPTFRTKAGIIVYLNPNNGKLYVEVPFPTTPPDAFVAGVFFRD